MKEFSPLSELVDAERETEVPFAALLDGEPIIVTAVLERTVVYYRVSDRRRSKEKHVARISTVSVRPEDVRNIRLKALPWRSRQAVRP